MSEEKTAEAGAEKSNPFRDGAGRFCKGNPGGPGNPFARYTAELRKAFAEEVKPDDLRKVARAMLEKAQGGDTAAARLVLSYTLGKPMEGTDPDRVDELECRQWVNEAAAAGQGLAVVQREGAALSCQVLRATVPVLSQIHHKTITDALAAPTSQDEDAQEDQDEGQEEAGGLPDLTEAERETLRRIREAAESGQILPIRPIADGKRSSGNGRAANPPKPESDKPKG